MKKKTIEIIEYETCEFEYELNSMERSYINHLAVIDYKDSRDYRFYFDEFPRKLRINALSWVGVIELDDLRVEIKPKFNRGYSELIDLICFINRIPFYNWKRTSVEYGQDSLIELLLIIFLAELERLLKHGLCKEYVTEEDNLQQMRGRPLITRHIRENFCNPGRMSCRFDELVTNIPENQIILSVLDIVSYFAVSDNTRRNINIMRSEFEKVCEPYPSRSMPKFFYNRLNNHYFNAHQLCDYIINHTFVSNIYKYRSESFCSMLFDMNKVFEQFLVEFFKKYLPKNYVVSPNKRIKDAIRLNGNCYRVIEPDMLILNKKTQEISVIDAKYKPYGRRKVDNSDLYQLSFYAQYINLRDCQIHNSIIIFPQYFNENSIQLSIVLLPNTNYMGEVKLQSISLEKTMQLVKAQELVILRLQALSLLNIGCKL